MRKVFVVLLTLMLPVFVFLAYRVNMAHAAPANPACLSITGKFTASGWKGGSMMVGCDGDAGKNCPGQIIKNLKPGDKFTFTKLT